MMNSEFGSAEIELEANQRSLTFVTRCGLSLGHDA